MKKISFWEHCMLFSKNNKLLNTMKIALLLCLLGTLGISAATVYSQEAKISLKLENVTVTDLLKKIGEKSEFSFWYKSNVIDENKKITINVKNLTVDKILDLALNEQKLNYLIKDRVILIYDGTKNEMLVKQSTKISGKIIDASTGDALPGVNVLVEGTTIGVVSDMDGKYTLDVPTSKSVLVFSFVGYNTERVEVGNRTSIDVSMISDIKSLDEIVVVGYGVQKKTNLTTAITKISDGSIKDRPITTIGEAFAGQLSGVRAQNSTGIPGAELNIKIRGINTINGNSNPLYVIDGVPQDNMNDLNPSDVASIQVLKDASATSIYGARGANGVIVIETKQGSGNASISFDAFYGMQQPVKMYDIMNGPEWTAYQIYARNEAWLRQGGSMKDAMTKRPANLQIPASWTDGSRPSVDWQDAIVTNAPISSYQLSASAKNDKGSIYISGGYLDQKGIIKETYYNRLNFRMNATLNASKNLRLGVNLAPSFSKQADQNTQGKETVIHHAIAQPPLIQLNEATQDLGFPNDFGLVYTNPLERLKKVTDNLDRNKITSSIWGDYKILKGLVFKSQYSYDFRSDIYEYFMPPLDKGSIPSGNSYVQRWNDLNIQNTLTYDFNLSDHVFNLLAGQTADKHTFYDIESAATGFPNSLVETLNVATTPTRAYTFKDGNTSASFFGRINYSYKDKYLVNASFRRDGSSRFGANNKWGNFPSASAGWKINEESFMKELSWLSLLKVRTSWGMAGNDRIGNYDYMALLRVDNTAWNNAIVGGLAPNNIGNDDLKWEATTTTDVGLDLSVLDNRFQFTFDYYINKTNDLLFSVPVPNSTGFGSYRTNLGEIENRGWEVDINTRNIVGTFNWSSSLNLSANKNKVLDMGSTKQFTSGNWDAQFITRVGGPVTQFYVYRSNGILLPADFDASKKALVPIMAGQVAGNERYVDQNNDGVINSLDLVPYGSNLPDLIYGFTNRFEYKGIELSVLLQGQFGGDILWLGQRQIDNGSNLTNSLNRWVHSWKPDYEAIYGAGENPIPSIEGVDMSWDGKTPYKLAGKNDNNSDLRIYDATFLKIKNVSLTYTLPKSILTKSLLKAAKVYISVDNLATFDNYPGVTTESNSFGNETTQAGVDYTTYPLSRRYTFGVNLTF